MAFGDKRQGCTWLKTSEAASEMGIEAQTLRVWRTQGFGPPFYKVAPHTVFYKLEEVSGWLDQFRCDPSTDVLDESIEDCIEEANIEVADGLWITYDPSKVKHSAAEGWVTSLARKIGL